MGGKLITHGAELIKDNFNRLLVSQPQFYYLQKHLKEVPSEMDNLGARGDISQGRHFF